MDMPPLEVSVYKVMAETGLTAQELNQLSMDEWATITGRETPSEIAVRAAGIEPPVPTAQNQAPADPEPESQRADVASMDWAAYAEFRQRTGIAARSSEGMTRAEVTLMNRMVRNEVALAGRTSWYSGQ